MDLGEVAGQLVDDERQEAERDDRQTGEPELPHAATLDRCRPRPGVRDQQRPEDRQQGDSQHVTLHRHGRPEGRHEPPARLPRAPGTPGSGEGDRARQRDEVRVPDECGLLDRGARDSHRESSDEPRERAADRACQPPGDGHRRDPRERDESRDGQRRVATRDEGCRGEQVVVERTMVDIADGSRWPQERNDAVADERAQHQHVVALVGIPRPARGQVRQPQQCCQDHQDDGNEGRSTARWHVVAQPRRDRHSGASAGSAGPGPRPGPVLDRLPRSVIASGGNSASGRHAAMSWARAMLIASYPSSIPGVSR